MSTETLETEVESEVAEPVIVARHPSDDSPGGGAEMRGSSHPALRPLSPLPTYIGIVVAAMGFVSLAIAWGGVAGESNVAFQVPYLVSGGLGGLALIMVGLTVINVAAKRRDAALRQHQIQLLAAALRALSESDQDGQ